MIKTKSTVKGILHYSDANFKIKQVETGIIYDTADDISPCPYTYEETNILIEDTEEATEEDYKTALNTLGVDTNEEINT